VSNLELGLEVMGLAYGLVEHWGGEAFVTLRGLAASTISALKLTGIQPILFLLSQSVIGSD